MVVISRQLRLSNFDPFKSSSRAISVYESLSNISAIELLNSPASQELYQEISKLPLLYFAETCLSLSIEMLDISKPSA